MSESLTQSNKFFGILACVICAFIFGFYPPAARIAYQEGANITLVVLFTTFCRMAGLWLYTYVRSEKIFIQPSEYKISAIAGIFQALSVIGILAGSYFMPGAVVIVIMFSYSLMLLLFNAWRGEIQLNIVNVTATVLALLGLILTLGIVEADIEYAPIGIVLAFLAALCTFARTYIYGRYSQGRSPIAMGAESFIVAFSALLLLLLWEMPIVPTSLLGGVMLIASAVSLTIGSFGMFWGIASLGAYRFSMIMKLEPVFTTMFGVLLIQDFLNASQYCGIALVIFSLVALQLFDKQKQNE